MADILSISSTAVGVYQRVLGVVSNNIANVGTEGYVKQDASIGQTPPTYDGRNFLGTGAMFQGVQRQYNAFIESSLRNATSDVASQDALVRYAERVIDVMGSGEIGLSPALDKFFSAARSLAADPASPVMRAGLLREADGLASRFRDLSAQLNQVEGETRGGINSVVSQVNVLTTQLAKLNVELSKQQTLTRQPPALLDQRDLLLRDLSKLVEIRSEEASNGMVKVSVGGPGGSGYVVDGTNSLNLEARFDESSADRVDLILDPYGTQTRTLSGMSGGEFGGLASLRLQVLEPALGQLDWLAKSVTQEVNRVHQSGVDAKGAQGGALFSIQPTFDFKTTGLGQGQPLKVEATLSDLNAYTGSPITLAFDGKAGRVFGVSLLGPFQQGDRIEVTLNGRTQVMKVTGDTSAASVTQALQTFIDSDSNDTRSDEPGFGVQLRTAIGANGEISVSSPFLTDYQFGVKVASDQARAVVDTAQGLWVATDPTTGQQVKGRQSLTVGGVAITIGGTAPDGEQVVIKASNRPAGAMRSLITDPSQVAAAASFRGVRGVENVGAATAMVTDEIDTAFTQYPATVAGAKGGIANNAVASEAIPWDATKQVPVGIIPAGQRDVVYYLDPMAASADLQIFSRDGRHLAGTGMSARPQSLQSVRIDTSAGTEATITTDYVPGQAGQNYIEFKARGEAGETLGFGTTGSISSGAGVLSLSGGVLYRGNGVRAERLGAVDTVYNGQGGKPLRINFVSAFENSSFDNGVAGSSSIPGWTVISQRVKLDGTDQVAGWPTPVNTTLPMGLTTAGTPIQSPGEASSVGGSFTTTLNDAVISTDSGLSVKLSSALTVSASGLAHGPAIVSANAIALREGDQVAIDWKATGTRDNFDVYGYLLNVDNGNTRTILDASGKTADWTTARTTVPVDGQYKFVFISGSHDYTGGTAAGSDFYIDNLRVTTTPPTLSSADVATLRGLVSYSNLYTASVQVNGQTITSDPGASTLAAATSLQAKIQQKISAGELKNINVSRTGDDLTLSATDPTVPFAVGQLSFSSASGQIQATTITLNDPGESSTTGQAFVGSHPVFNTGSTYSAAYINTLGEPGYRDIQTFYGVRALPLTVQPNGIDHLSQGDQKLPARVRADFAPFAQGVNIPEGALTLNGRPMTGFTGTGAGAVATWFNTNAGSTGIKATVENGAVMLTRPVGNGDGSIQIGFGPGGSPRVLASLGFRTGAYVVGEVPEDLVVFASGTGSVKVSASWQGQAWDAAERRQAQRETPFEIRFSSPTRYTIVDADSGHELAARDYTPGSEIVHAGLRIQLSDAPAAGDKFRVDGNKVGLGDNANVLRLVELEKAKIADPDKTLTFSESYLATVDKVSNITQQAQTSLKALEVVKQQTSDARESVSGVSLDEEAANLIRFQQAYQAAAKSMQIASQMFDAVLRI